MSQVGNRNRHQQPRPPQGPQLPPPPRVNHHTTTQILEHTTAIFYARLFTFLVLSLAIFVYRYCIEQALGAIFEDNSSPTHVFLSRILFPGNPLIHQYHRPSQFKNLLLKNSTPETPVPNSRLFVPIFDEAILPRTLGTSHHIPRNSTFIDQYEVENSLNDSRQKSLKMGRHDDAADPPFTFIVVGLVVCSVPALFLTVAFSCAHVHAIVYLLVVDHLSGNQRSLVRSVLDGAKAVPVNLLIFTLIKWFLRNVVAVFLVVLLTVNFMPVINLAPRDSTQFIVYWMFADLKLILIYGLSVGSWISIADQKLNIGQIVDVSFHLLGALPYPPRWISVLEAIICGSFGRWLLWWILGGFLSLAFQCVMEVYFMVAWLLFYLSSRNSVEGLPAHVI